MDESWSSCLDDTVDQVKFKKEKKKKELGQIRIKMDN